MKTKITKIERVEVPPRVRKLLGKLGAVVDKLSRHRGTPSVVRKPDPRKKRSLLGAAKGQISFRGDLTKPTIQEAIPLGDFLALRAAAKEPASAKATGAVLSTEAVGKRLRVGKAAIYKAKNEGRLLAYREPWKRAFLFPVFQFDGASVAPWVLEVVDLLGNGFAALHFLTVERKSLKGDSYLTRLRGSRTANERTARIQWLLIEARRLVPDVANEEIAFQRVKMHSRGVEEKLLAEEGGTLSEAEFAKKLGVGSRTTIKNHRKQCKIFAVPRGAGNLCYPVWQIHKRELLPGLQETLKALAKHKLHPFSSVLFFLTPAEALEDERPLDLLRRNEVAPVVAHAQHYGSKK